MTTKLWISVLSIAFALFQLYTAGTHILAPALQRGIHLGFALVLIFMIKQNKRWYGRTWDLLMVLGSLAALAFFIVTNPAADILRRMSPTALELFFGGMLIVAVIDSCRRMGGWGLAGMTIAIIGFGIWGYLLPFRAFRHAGMSFKELVAINYLGMNDGLLGSILAASANYIFILVLFGGLLFKMGAGDLIINIAYALVGHVRGGPAKIAVVASSLFGSINGSTAANVATTGSVTIPMMKRMGYDANFAGGVEASSSVGGQFLPPIMGASVFIMALFLGVTYNSLMFAGLIPAIAYELCQFIIIDIESKKLGLRGLPRSEVPRVGEVLKKNWQHLLPIIVLIILLAGFGMSPHRSAFWSIVALLVTQGFSDYFSKKKTLRDFVERFVAGCETGVKNAILIASMTACVGILLGVIGYTGTVLNLTALLVSYGGNSILLVSIIGAVAAMTLGMGLPTVASYTLLAILVAPALIQLGIVPVAAHFFILYYAAQSAITPPVAIGAVVATGIAGGNFLKTCLWANIVGIQSWIIPFMFIFNPALLLAGSAGEVAFAILKMLVVLFSIAYAVEGMIFGRITLIERILHTVLSVMLIAPYVSWGIAGMIGFVLLVLLDLARYWFRNKRSLAPSASS